MGTAGATNEVATLKEAVSVAERNAAAERAEREKQEARVAVVRQELQALMEKHESLERDSKTRESELASALESAKTAKADAHKSLQEIELVRKIAASKEFFHAKQACECKLRVTYPNSELSRGVCRSASQRV